MKYEYLNNTGADIRLIGFPNILSPFTHFNSAPRVLMLNHHLPQTMIVDKPEFNKTFTGVEHNFIDYTFGSAKRDHDCQIVAVIPKYREPLIHRDLCPQFYVITLTLEPNGVKRLDYFEVNRYFMGSHGFGFLPKFENMARIQPGEYLSKETVITHSAAVGDNEYRLGKNANVAYGSFPETIEDAFIVSQSFAESMQTQQVSQLTINCRMDRWPLNLNGNEYESKFLPDIGSTVGEDGALCAFRPVHWTTCVADADQNDLRKPLPLQDDIIYIEPGSKILDLTFHINRQKMNYCYDQARLYEQNNTKCWEGIYATYIKYEGKHELTDKMSTLVTTAMYRMIAQGAPVPSLDPQLSKAVRNFDIEGANGHLIDFMQVVVTYTVPRKVSNGTKLTDLGGAKGVVGCIYPDDWMPVDEDGIRADMWIDMNSPVSRNNPGQLYETGINRISEFVRRKVAKLYEESGVEDGFNLLMEWYGDVNPNYEKRIREVCVTPEDRKGILLDAIHSSPKIWIPPFLDTLRPSKEEFWNALINIKKWAAKWDVKPSRITYKSLQADGTGKEFTTEAKFSIGSKYILQLHKIPEIFAPGPASVNHIGIPTKANHENKNFPVTVNPYRFGEDELRVMAMDTDIREVTRFQNLGANSPLGVNCTIRSILLSDHPTRIKRIPISNGQLSGDSAVLKLFHNITATLGVETKSTKIDAFEVPEELTDSIWSADIVNAQEMPVKMFNDEGGVSKRDTAKRGKVKKMIDAMQIDELEEEIAKDNAEAEEGVDIPNTDSDDESEDDTEE